MSLNFKIFFELQEQALGIGICHTLLPFNQLILTHATQREPALAKRFRCGSKLKLDSKPQCS